MFLIGGGGVLIAIGTTLNGFHGNDLQNSEGSPSSKCKFVRKIRKVYAALRLLVKLPSRKSPELPGEAPVLRITAAQREAGQMNGIREQGEAETLSPW